MFFFFECFLLYTLISISADSHPLLFLHDGAGKHLCSADEADRESGVQDWESSFVIGS